MSDLNLFLAEANEDFKIVTVNFPGSPKRYNYKTTLDIKEGDHVVVDSPVDGFKVLEAIEVIPALETELSNRYELKWIVSKVDVEYYNKCIEMERAATKALNRLRFTKRRTELLKQLEEEIGEEGISTVKGLIRL